MAMHAAMNLNDRKSSHLRVIIMNGHCIAAHRIRKDIVDSGNHFDNLLGKNNI